MNNCGRLRNKSPACATPFKRFLLDAEFDYVFTKFMGNKLDRFDGEASVREVRQWIITDRLNLSLDKAEAREAWDAVEEVASMAKCSEHDFGTAMFDVAQTLGKRHPMHDNFADPCGWPRCTRYDAQADSFWKQIWPLFTDALKAELQAVPTEALEA